jgi:predicted RNA-binding Zn ribbon-like protein
VTVTGLSVRELRPRDERQPGGRRAAPGELGLAQAFVNTYWDLDDREAGDQLASPDALARWLRTRGLLHPGMRLGEDELRRALDLRHGLHALALANNGAAIDPAAIERLNEAVHVPGLFLRFAAGSPPDFRAARRDFESALAVIGTIVAVAQLDGRWARLKACRGDHCGWAFYDDSPNQGGQWCSMSICGSRAKARAYRRRQMAKPARGESRP